MRCWSVLAILSLLIDLAIAGSVRSEEVDFHFENGQKFGVVEQVYGDLVYVSGLNGSAPVLSSLRVLVGANPEGATLEVIKELDRLLVARIVVENRDPVSVSDRVARINGDMAPSSRLRALRVFNATRIERGPKLDGSLDDEIWENIHPIEGFIQRDPGYWNKGSERTLARIAFDENKLYFGFECYDSEPEKVVANNMRRDNDLGGDDNIQILLDTYDDRQTAVYFVVNALGARQDMMLSQEGRTRNEDWDCIWDAKARRHNNGWTVEVEIPLDQLRFKEGKEVVWGINLSRYVARKDESTTLMVGRKSKSFLQRYSTSDLAELKGLESLKTKGGFPDQAVCAARRNKERTGCRSICRNER